MARENALDVNCPAKSERFFRSQRIASLDMKVFSGREMKLTFECAVFITSETPELFTDNAYVTVRECPKVNRNSREYTWE